MEADRYLDCLRAQHQPWADDWLRELDQWNALEDEPERSRLARELESEDDGVFMSAAFELFLSGSFRQRGWRVERHPSIQRTRRRFEIWRVTTVGSVVGGWSLTGDAAIPVTTHVTLADAVDKKTSRYGRLGLPYIVAVQPVHRLSGREPFYPRAVRYSRTHL